MSETILKLQTKLERANQKIELLEELIEDQMRTIYSEQEINKKFAYFATYSPYPVVRIDGEGIITLSNMAANEYFKQEKLRGVAWNELVDMNLAKIDMTKGYLQHEYHVHGKDLLLCYKNIPELEVINIYGFDITDSKQIERELEEERARHIHSMQMATLGEMAGGMAHELNTPLGLMSLSIKQIETCYTKGKTDMFHDIIADMYGTIDRMSKLINGFKTFSRNTNENDFTFVNLKKLIEECIEICKMSLKDDGVELFYPEDIRDISIECNPTEISQVLINLVQNARDAISGSESPWIKIEMTYGDELVIKVIDSGAGVPPEVEEKLFVPFYTTKEIGKGTGLGLSIIKGIVERHNGEIGLDKDCPNTCFRFRIPVLQNIGAFL